MQTPGAGAYRGTLPTVTSWLAAPFNRWALWHVREMLPTHRISRGIGAVRALPAAAAYRDVRAIDLVRRDGTTSLVGDVLDQTFTDAWVVLQDGELVGEWYGPQGADDGTHAVMSITKSVVGCVAAVLVERGLLDPDALVTGYLPELGESGFAGATVRDLLDMRSGVSFREDYTDPEAEVRQLDHWVGWRPQDNDDQPLGLYRFLATLRAEVPHGRRFLYRSAETDALGWVCERAGGARMADLVSTLLWVPMGAEHDAEIFCDGLGTAIHDGGLGATARDLARFGQMLLDAGGVPDGNGNAVHDDASAADPWAVPGERVTDVPRPMRSVVPSQWFRQAWGVTSDLREAFVASPVERSFPGGWYRNQLWFRPGEFGDVMLCLGIHGQMLHVSRRTRTVCVKLSSWPDPVNPVFMQDTLRAFDAVGGALAGRSSPSGKRHLPGGVSGLSRYGGGSVPRSGSML
jgi:CubicO group peptidase (beta-lactamase class C family)